MWSGLLAGHRRPASIATTTQLAALIWERAFGEEPPDRLMSPGDRATPSRSETPPRPRRPTPAADAVASPPTRAGARRPRRRRPPAPQPGARRRRRPVRTARRPSTSAAPSHDRRQARAPRPRRVRRRPRPRDSSSSALAPDPYHQRPDHKFGESVQEVTERISLLVREEIELAKAEVEVKVKSLAPRRGDRRRGRRLRRRRPLRAPASDRLAPGYADVFERHRLARLPRHGLHPLRARRPRRLPRHRGSSRRARRPRPTWPSRRPSASARPSDQSHWSVPGVTHLMPAHAGGDPRLDRGQPHASSARRSSACAARSPSPPTGAGSIRRNERNVVIGAAVAGFVIGGGIAGVVGLFRRR